MGERKNLYAKNEKVFVDKSASLWYNDWANTKKEGKALPKQRKLNIVVTYGDTGYGINDLGEAKSPRYELCYIPETKAIKKSNNPLDFDEYMETKWKRVDS